MKTQSSRTWQKIASVTRPGKFFYRSNDGFSVIQSFLTGKWSCVHSDQTRSTEERHGFDTPSQAKQAASELA